MEWKNHYNQHICTALEAVDAVKDNYKLVYGNATGFPQVFCKALAQEKDRFTNVTIYNMLMTSTPWHIDAAMKGHLNTLTSFVTKPGLKGMQEGLIEFIPCYLRQVPLLFSEGYYPVDVAVVQLSPPNDEGYCSYGVANDYTKPAADNARIVIGEVNDQTPFTYGDNYIHVTDLDYIIECSYPLVETPSPEATEVEFAIARHCASLIKDGDIV